MNIFMNLLSGIIVVSMAFLLGCGPSLTVAGWKNPEKHQTVSRVVVWAMFKRLDYQSPFEEAAASILNSKGLNGVQALKLLNPKKKYELPELEKILNDADADALLIFNYKGLDKQTDYIEPTTTYYPNYFNDYYSYYTYGYSGYASAYGNNEVTTGGYEVTTTVIELVANLYSVADKSLLWTGVIKITDPQYVDLAAKAVMKEIYSDWVKGKLVKSAK
jgi:hypothetical protein